MSRPSPHLDDFFAPESLCEELNATIQQRRKLSGIFHPLVVSFPHFPQLNKQMNASLRWKREQVSKAIVRKDWNQVVFLHERPFRLQAFYTLHFQMSDRDYWKLLASVWIDSEGVYVNTALWRKLFASKRAGRGLLMTTKERRALRALPETFTVYRGALARHRNGFSWTLDKARAEWFARRWSQRGIVHVATVKRNDVIAYMTGRNEDEIIINPTKLRSAK